jgi:hypothetical protein
MGDIVIILYRILSTIVLLALIVLFKGNPLLVVVGFIGYIILMTRLGRRR